MEYSYTMSLEDVQNYADENIETKTTIGRTNLKVDTEPVNRLKSKVNVSHNTEITPLVESAIYSYLGDEEKADEKEKEFKNQFED